MNKTISPVRRFGAALVIAGIAAFGSVAVAPAALADETAAVQSEVVETTPAPAPVVDEPAAKPSTAPKFCTAEDLEAFAKDSAKYEKQAAQMSELADKAKAGADAIKGQSKNLKGIAKKLADEVAKGLDKVAKAFEQKAQDLLDQAMFGLTCIIEGGPRF
jgi:hypothetical protein